MGWAKQVLDMQAKKLRLASWRFLVMRQLLHMRLPEGDEWVNPATGWCNNALWHTLIESD
jgi:hypothetical protein